MVWRTVAVSRSSKLDYKLGYMVVRDSENTVRVHISEISVLIIENTASSVTTALLNELDLFYRDIVNNHIRLLVIENKACFEKNGYENLVILDNDFCEIVEK